MWNIESWHLSQDLPNLAATILAPICLYAPIVSHAMFSKYSPDVSWRLVWLRGLWLPICVALWLLALCVVASVWSCHCGALCVARRADNRGGGGELVSGIGPYPASEEIDRRPLISCRAVPIGKKSSSSSDERTPVCQVGISCGNLKKQKQKKQQQEQK